MRSWPSCWNTTLAKLGFRRKAVKTRRKKRGGAPRFHIERLEAREMLAGNTYVVTTLDDVAVAGTTTDDLWSLREALTHAATSGHADADVIRFDPALTAGTIALDSSLGQLTVAGNVRVAGPGSGSLAVDAQGNHRVFGVVSGTTATISGLTITGGGNVTSGGGVSTQGNLTLEDVVVAGNSTILAGLGVNHGGGIYLDGGGSLRLLNTTVDGNQARYGGGVFARLTHAGSLDISSSTISNNLAIGRSNNNAPLGSLGGALLLIAESSSTGDAIISNSTLSGNSSMVGGAISIRHEWSKLRIVNSTIVENNTSDPWNGNAPIAEGHAGGIQAWSPTGTPPPVVTLHNTILANNTGTNPGLPDVWGNIAGSPSEPSSHSILGVKHTGVGIGSLADSGLVHGQNQNIVGNQTAPIDPKLTPLGLYGGPTRTHALLPSSPARDAGDDAVAAGLVHDQRGSALTLSQRIVGDAVDIGAFEYGAVVIKADAPSQLTPGGENSAFPIYVDPEGDGQDAPWVATNSRGQSVVVWRGARPRGGLRAIRRQRHSRGSSPCESRSARAHD